MTLTPEKYDKRIDTKDLLLIMDRFINYYLLGIYYRPVVIVRWFCSFLCTLYILSNPDTRADAMQCNAITIL